MSKEEVFIEEVSEEELIGRAITKAEEAFAKVFEEEGYDPAFWSLDLKVKRFDSNFKKILYITERKDFSAYGIEDKP